MKKIFFAVFASFFFLIPSAHAANLPIMNPDFSIVPQQCTSCPCGYAGTLQLVQNLVNLGISIAFVVLIIIIVYAGALFMLSPASPGNREMGKTVLVNAFIGLVIVLCAWLLVDFVMKALYNPNAETGQGAKLGPWNEIIGGTGEWCIVEKPMKSLYNGEALGDGADISAVPSGGTVGTAGCPTCVALKDFGVSCTNAQKCTLDPAVATKLGQLKKNYSGNWIVTEAYPPSFSGHSNACHTNGTCVDADFIGGTEESAQNAKAFSSAAGNAGLRVVWETNETGPCPKRDAAVKLGVKAFCKADEAYKHITGTHFSVYGN